MSGDEAALTTIFDAIRSNTELAKRAIDLLEKRQASSAKPALRAREQKILAAVGSGRLQAKQIARALSVELSRSLQNALADMVRFGMLERDNEGYAAHADWKGTAAVLEDDDEA